MRVKGDPTWGEANSPTDSRLDTVIELLERHNELLEMQLGLRPKTKKAEDKKPERARE